jgi:hypothetical protein
MSVTLATSDFVFLMQHSLMAFTEYTFRELFPQTLFSDSPHLSILAAKLEECASGKCKRLIIRLPPRSLKSIMTSVAFPAWLLGKRPHLQLICASYGQSLSFAQFEREVTGERIRDKVAASKKKRHVDGRSLHFTDQRRFAISPTAGKHLQIYRARTTSNTAFGTVAAVSS